MDKTRTRTNESGGALGASALTVALSGALYCFCGYLSGIAALPFGAYPFGIALLAAANKNAIFIFAGLAAASFGAFEGSSAILLFGIYSALLLVRVLVRLTLDAPHQKKSLGELFGMLFEEQIGYRVCAAAIAAFGLSLAILLSGGFLYYDLFGLLICTLAAPIAAYPMSKVFKKEDTDRRAWLHDVGWGLIFGICMLGARPLQVYGVSLAVAGGMLLVLAVCRKRGFLRGILLAALLGMLYMPALCPIFLIAALAWGAFARFSPTLVSVAALFGSLGYAFYASGIYALDGTVGGIIAASLGFSVYARVSRERGEAPEEKEKKAGEREAGLECRVLDEGELDGVRLSDMNLRMSAMSESLFNISRLFEELELKFPRTEEILGICERAFEVSCAGCPERAACTSERIRVESGRLAGILERSGEIRDSDLVGGPLESCGRACEILDEINYNYAIRFGRANGQETCGAEGECFDGYGYKLISELLAKGMEDGHGEYAVELAASAALCEPLDALGCEIVGVLVYGRRQRRVLIRGARRDLLEGALSRICEVVRSVTGIELDADKPLLCGCGGSGDCRVELRERKRLAIASHERSEARGGRDRSGDSLEIFENCDGYGFICISDGMGSGRDAARSSELTVGFLRNMLSRGRVSRELLSMLNSFLKARCPTSAQECSATLDLLELDLVSGEAVFYKCGAAPTYVCRGANLFKLRSRTMPLGILSSPDVKEQRLTLGEGDLVVMMSDGVSGGREDCPYLFDLLRQNAFSPGEERTAELIMKYAHSSSEPDDTTVVVARVRRNA